jgi:hypothetical protein
MANATRKEIHSYRISYAQEVGSSIDPDLEDVASWEQELTGVYNNISVHPKGSVYSLQVPKLIPFFPGHAGSGLANATTSTRPPQEGELTPIDLDDEELAAYAEERAALADFDDIPEEELFSWSDFEEPDEHEYDMDVA